MSEEQQERFVFFLCPNCGTLLKRWAVHKTFYERFIYIVDTSGRELDFTRYDNDVEIEKIECPECGWEDDDGEPDEYKIAITRRLEIIPFGKYWQSDPDNALLIERNRIIEQFLEIVGDGFVEKPE